MAFTPEEERDIKRLAREAVGGTPLEQVEEVDDFESGDLVPFMKYDGDNDTFKTAKIAGTNIGSGGGGGGGEPSQYLKDASVSQDGNTLTLVKKNNSTVTFTPNTGGTGTVTGVKVGSEGEVIDPTQGVVTLPPYESGAQVHIAPTASEVKTALGTGSGTTKYLREDGQWVEPQGGGGGGNTADVNYDTTNKKITKTIDGVTSDVVTVTTLKTDMNLDNVGNFKAVSTEASQGLTDTEKGNARTNIGAGTSNFSGSYNDLSNKPAIPTVPTNVSAFTNDAGYLTHHQDISGKADKSDTYTKTEINNLISSTPESDAIVVNVPSGSDIATYLLNNVPAAQRPNNIFRVPGTTSYSEWAWNGTAFIQLDEKDYGFDEAPTENSTNLLTSGTLYDEFKKRDDATDTSLLTKYSEITVDADDKVANGRLFDVFYGLTMSGESADGLEYILDKYKYMIGFTNSKYAIVAIDSDNKIITSCLYGFYGFNESVVSEESKESYDYMMLYSDVDRIFIKESCNRFDVDISGHCIMLCDRELVPLNVN